MKKLNLIAAAIALATAASGASAQVSDSFDVTINFTGGCSVKSTASDLTFAYTAFRATPMTGTATTVFQCSRGLTPTFSLSGGTDMVGSTGIAVAGTVTGEGVIAGIRYTLSGTATQSQTGTAASTSSEGTADEYTVALGANLAAGQAGDGTTGGGTHTRTLTISY